MNQVVTELKEPSLMEQGNGTLAPALLLRAKLRSAAVAKLYSAWV